MISSVSSSSNVVQSTREVVDTHRVNRIVNVEKLHIEKDVVTTHVVNREQLNYVYNVQNRTIHQPVDNVGSIINITA